MRQTPIYDFHNAELMALVPKDATRVIEVGCGGGALAREYLKVNPRCDYIGIEIDAGYAEIARKVCSSVVVGDIEHMSDEVFNPLFPCSCWIFGDVLEHLHDPWSVLRRIRKLLPSDSSVLACIPNAQHWSVQARLNCGLFRYEDAGLLDRTHIRWFTRITALELFHSCGFQVVDGGRRLMEMPHADAGLAGVRAMAEAIGANVEAAVSDAIPVQWIIRAMPGAAAEPAATA